MKNTLITTIAIAIMGIFILGFTIVNEWKVDDDKYSVKISGKSIDGTFKGLKADIVFDPAHLEKASIEASVDATSLSTGNFLKTKHALSEEALDADKYPRIAFKSARVTKKAEHYEFEGTLTLKGVTKNVTIPLAFIGNDHTGSFKGVFKINPKAYNLTRHGVPDEVTVTLNVPVTR